MPRESNAHSTESTTAAVRPLSGLVLSAGFWGCLFAAGVLFGAVSLAARVVEREQLQHARAIRQGELLTLQQEVRHLERVVHELRADSRLAASVARHELQAASPGLVKIPLNRSLQHDPRAQSPTPIDIHYEEPIYLPLLQSLADSPERRWRWSLLAAGLLAFGFIFLHEHAGSRTVGRVLIAPWSRLGRRYASRSTDPSRP